MPYQNLDSEILLAFSIWLLAMFIFGTMMILAAVEMIVERRSRMKLDPRPQEKRWQYLRYKAVRIFQRMKGN